jgi:hypothetical protein
VVVVRVIDLADEKTEVEGQGQDDEEGKNNFSRFTV